MSGIAEQKRERPATILRMPTSITEAAKAERLRELSLLPVSIRRQARLQTEANPAAELLELALRAEEFVGVLAGCRPTYAP